MRGLSGKRVIVTGGGSGIGRAVCERFGEEGAEVAVFDLNEEGAQETARIIQGSGGKAQAFKADITDRGQVDKAVAEFEAGGPIDVLVNNAGWDEIKPFLDTDAGLWKKVIDINLYGNRSFQGVPVSACLIRRVVAGSGPPRPSTAGDLPTARGRSCG